MELKWICTTENKPWEFKKEEAVIQRVQNVEDFSLFVHKDTAQTIDGFGGCFNELGWEAIQLLDESQQMEVYDALFDKENGMGLNLCRIPIGASDYALDWYSLNESPEDYTMENFSIERDKNILIPYIKEALKRRSDIEFFASPWSPPTWMKHPRVYNYGHIRMEKLVLDSYALYFRRFIEFYHDEGIDIKMIHIQNEPFADQKFPSCVWQAEDLRVFIRDHMGPLFEQWGMDTEIWLGTLNGPTQMEISQSGIAIDLYDKYVDHILYDDVARKYIKGVGYQWAGRESIQRTHQSFPELKLMQTENECGQGDNSYIYAQYVFNLIRHYMTNGANSYCYWNMVLQPGGESSWGWKQNAMITVSPDSKEVTYNPEFYVMKHFSAFVQPGAKYVKTSGHHTGNAAVFQNPDQSYIIVISNGLDRDVETRIGFDKISEDLEGVSIKAELKANSFNTFIVSK